MTRRMASLATAVVFTLAGFALAEDPAFVNLFDGKTLNGWVPEHTNRFSVRDGVIFSDGGVGWLRTAKSYKDFELQIEYRALKPGADSGLFFRASTECTPKEPFWPARGYQLQLIDGESNLKIFGHGTPPPTSERHTEALKKAMKAAGEWQQIRLKVVGKHAEASLNGMLVTVSDAITLVDGYVGLQGENGQFEWRDLKIRELASQ